MISHKPITFLVVLYFLGNIYACSSEPTTKEECIDKYLSNVKNNNAAKEIKQACASVFDTNETDDEFYKCLLEKMPSAKTDKEVNIIIRKCRMEGSQ